MLVEWRGINKIDYFNFFLVNSIPQSFIQAIIPRGYTKQFIDGEVDQEEQRRAIMTAFAETNAKSDVMVSFTSIQ